MGFISFSLLIPSLSASLHAFPSPKLTVKPLGRPGQPVAGTFFRNLTSEPENLNPLSSNEYGATQVASFVVEGLLTLNPDTHEFEPGLAESYSASKDNLTFTFHLNPKARFADGKKVSSEDVKFSVEAVRDPAFKAAARMPFFEDVDTIETPDPGTVVFRMKKKYFKNLEVLATTPILPKHLYKDAAATFPVAPLAGSGPYKVEAYDHGKNIVLARDKDWWAQNEPGRRGLGKFERIHFRFVKEENLQIEMLKKGQLDFMQPISPENFEKKATGEPFGTQVRKIEAENKIPKRWYFIAWNQKDPSDRNNKNIYFADRDTRLALSMLFNRKLLMDKFMYGKTVEGRGPVYYRSAAMPADLKPIEFSPEKAAALLKKSGWEDRDKDGVLEKIVDGSPVPFRFALLLPNRENEKYYTIYKEDLKRAGIEMEIKLIEWSAFASVLDEQKFDAITLAWAGGSPEEDLKQIWHSSSAREGGSNFVSYANPEVDKWIDAAREEPSRDKRAKLWQKAVRLIAGDAVYTYLFNYKYDQFLLNARIGYDRPTYTFDPSTPYWFLTK